MNTTFENAGPQGLIQEEPGAYSVPPPARETVIWSAEDTSARADAAGSAKSLTRAIALQLTAIGVGAVGLAFVFVRFSSILESLGNWGYVGVAAAEFGNSAMLFLPTPAPAYTFTMGAILNPLIVGVVGGVFATLGELVGYFLGCRGSSILADRPIVIRLKRWMDRWGTLVLFGFAALPVPFDIAGVWAGTARYPLVKFVPVVLLGKTIKITMISLAGYFGLEALMNLVG